MTEEAVRPAPERSHASVRTRGWLLERRRVLAWWAGSRALVFATAYALHLVGGQQGFFGRALLARPFGVLGSWDGIWYRLVAEHGYLLVAGRQSDPAFFPGFPLLLAAAHTLSVPPAVAGIAIANAAFLVALLAFHELSRAVLRDHAAAERATLLLTVFPIGFVFSMPYPESVALAAMTGAALLARRARWTCAAAAAAAAALSRPEALFVAVPVASLAWSRRSELTATARGAALAAVAAPAAALLSFPLYLGWSLREPLAWSHAQRAWGRSFDLRGPSRAVEQLLTRLGQERGLGRDAVFFALYLALLGYGARKRLPRAWLAAGAAIVVLPVFSGSFASVARFGLLAPPLFWTLALLVDRRGFRLAMAVSAALLVLGVATLPYAPP